MISSQRDCRFSELPESFRNFRNTWRGKGKKKDEDEDLKTQSQVCAHTWDAFIK